MQAPKIFYLAPDNTTPSWGLGIIYHHVKALTEAGFEAFLVHEKKGFKLEWLDVRVPTLYWNTGFRIQPEDVLVVPEVMVNVKELKKLNCRKLLFVQASSFLFEMLPEGESHRSLGFEAAIGIMPHMMPIITQFTGLAAYMIPPFVAEYFFKAESKLHDRSKTILIFPKFHQQDFGIVRRLVSDKLKEVNDKGFKALFKKQWKLEVLKGKTHRQIAELMHHASFFIATNTFESFNASVVEAMAGGCIPVCYEGFGPRDYLKDGGNAFVFGNNEAFRLCNQVFHLIDYYEDQEQQLKKMRAEAYRLANTYTYEHTKEQLINFFKSKLSAA